ncbi:hypothetical protein HKX48_006019 [Thoreauomyces humboldtii]|nr:hypothetical protein HKX48_006019 [Thoreauomyces humboldtii]
MTTARDDVISSGEEDETVAPLLKATLAQGKAASSTTTKPISSSPTKNPFVEDGSPEVIEVNDAAGTPEKEKAGAEDDEDDDEAEEVYEFEKILGHRRTKGKDYFFIKWKGYPSEQNTWEPAEHIGEKELIDEFWAENPPKKNASAKKVREKPARPAHRPARAASGVSAVFTVDSDPEEAVTAEKPDRNSAKKRARSPSSPPARASTRKLQRKSQSVTRSEDEEVPVENREADDSDEDIVTHDKMPHRFTLMNSWESLVKDVTNIEISPVDENALLVFLEWKNGMRSSHPSPTINRKCPQAMLRFYEAHIRFSHPNPEDEIEPDADVPKDNEEPGPSADNVDQALSPSKPANNLALTGEGDQAVLPTGPTDSLVSPGTIDQVLFPVECLVSTGEVDQTLWPVDPAEGLLNQEHSVDTITDTLSVFKETSETGAKLVVKEDHVEQMEIDSATPHQLEGAEEHNSL